VQLVRSLQRGHQLLMPLTVRRDARQPQRRRQLAHCGLGEQLQQQVDRVWAQQRRAIEPTLVERQQNARAIRKAGVDERDHAVARLAEQRRCLRRERLKVGQLPLGAAAQRIAVLGARRSAIHRA
jgi:hypothetical protein